MAFHPAFPDLTTPIISSTKSLMAQFAGPSSGRRSRCHTRCTRNSESPERYGISPSLSRSYDTNYLFNEVVDGAVRRAQFGQTLSVSHSLYKKLGISGEIWHFTQPFLRSNTVGNLWALNYNVRKNLVLDGGFNRGFTNTSTRWETFAGFTYLLPHKVSLH